MTRKRFCKYLMGGKVSRNAANQIAARYRSIGMPYCVAMADHLLGFQSASIQEHIEAMNEILEETGKIAGKMCKTFGELCEAMLRIAKEEKKHEFCN